MKFFYLILAIVIFAIAAHYLVENMPDNNPEEYGKWGLALLALNLLPSLHYVLIRRKNVPFIPLVGIFYILSFGLPIFFVDIIDFQLGTLDIRALQLGFWGLLIFYILYYFSYTQFRYLKPFAPVKNRYMESTFLIKVLMYAFLVVAIVGKLYPYSTLRHFYDPSIYIFAGLYLYLYLNKRLNFLETVLLGTLLGAELISRFTISLLASSARYMLFLTMIYYLVKRRIPYIMLIMAVSVYLLALPVKMEYRAELAENEEEMTAVDKLELFYNLAYDNYVAGKQSQAIAEDKTDTPFWRFSYSSSALSRVISLTPHVVPYWEGKTYATLYSKLIPRFLWPDKPTEELGQEFGHRYHILDSDDYITSMNLPWLAELYANWGEYAIYIGMGIFGILFGFIDRFYNSGTNVINVIISAAIYFPIITQESNFALEAGNMFLLSLALYVFVIFVVNNFKSRIH